MIRQESPIISGMSVAKEMQSSALIEQWENAIGTFLVIDEEAPEYETPTGRRKRRKSVIGRLQGAHDSTTGIIDIAMVGSVCMVTAHIGWSFRRRCAVMDSK